MNIHRLAISLGWAKHSTRPDSVRLEAWLNSRTGLVWLGPARHGVIRGLARLILTSGSGLGYKLGFTRFSPGSELFSSWAGKKVLIHWQVRVKISTARFFWSPSAVLIRLASKGNKLKIFSIQNWSEPLEPLLNSARLSSAQIGLATRVSLSTLGSGSTWSSGSGLGDQLDAWLRRLSSELCSGSARV